MGRIHDLAKNGDLTGVLAELTAKPSLLESADVSTGYTPLLSACDEGHQSIVAALLDKGADIEARSSDGETPLQIAFTHGDLETMTMLLKRGANLSVSLHMFCH